MFLQYNMKNSVKIFMTSIFLLILCQGITISKTFKITIVSGQPSVFLYLSVINDYFIPEVDRRLASLGHKIKWNQAYGGTISKVGAVLESVEMGLADMGAVMSIFEPSNMPLHNVSYHTPFGSGNASDILEIIGDLQTSIPEFSQEWSRHNQVYLGGYVVDSYGILSNYPINTVKDIKGYKFAAPGATANWLKNTGGVPVASNMGEYYNAIKLGTYDGAIIFMSAAYMTKLYEVAPYVCMINFGAQFAGGISINKDVFDSFPLEVQKIFIDAGHVYEQKFAQILSQKTSDSMKAMEKAGATIVYLSDEQRKIYADQLPNIPLQWAQSMGKKNLPGRKILNGFLNGLQNRGIKLLRDWDK